MTPPTDIRLLTFADHPLPDRSHRPYRSGLFVERAHTLPLADAVVIAPMGPDEFNNRSFVVRPFRFAWGSFSSEQYRLFARLNRILKLTVRVARFVYRCRSRLLFRVTNGYLGVIAALLKRTGDLVVIDCCDFYFDLYREFGFPLAGFVCPIIFRFERMAVRSADIIIVDTPAQRDYIVATFEVGAGRVAVLPNGVLLEKYPAVWDKDPALCADFGITEHDFVLFYGGDISSVDGVEIALRFVRENEKLHGSIVKLIVIGKGMAGYIDGLKASAADLIASGRVRFDGFKPYDEYWRYMSLADVCLAPFKVTPTTGNVECGKIITYLLASKQVVCTSAKGVRSIYGDSVMYFDDGDFDSFSHAVRRAHAAPRTLQGKMRQRAKGELFDFDRIMDAEIVLVRRLLTNAPLAVETVERELGIPTTSPGA